MITIGRNIDSLRTQRKLSESSTSLQQSFERLSSGSRINKASDDAAGLAVTSALNVQSRVFTQGVRNLNDGISYLNTAGAAADSLKDILIRMKELAAQASNGTYSYQQRKALDSETGALRQEYNRIVEGTKFNGVRVFNGSNSSVSLQTGFGSDGILAANLNTNTVGDGTFSVGQTISIGGTYSAYGLVSGDFNRDGKNDIIVGDTSTNKLRFYAGNGNGTFAAAVSFPVSYMYPVGFEAGDFNNDGVLDLATSYSHGAESVEVILGNGDGTFRASVSYGTNGSEFLTVADLNDDGIDDIVGPRFHSGAGNTTSYLISNGDGTFKAQQTLTHAAASGPQEAVVADFNNDGKVDIVVSELSAGNATISFGNGAGTFQAPSLLFYLGFAFSGIAGADFNGDRNIDLVTADGFYGTRVALSNGNGTFQAQISVGGSPVVFGEIKTGDFNYDGKVDLIVQHDTKLEISFGNGDGTFGSVTSYNMGGGAALFSPSLADFNGDGVNDIAVSDVNGGTVNLLLANTVRSSLNTITDIRLTSRREAREAQGAIDTLFNRVSAVTGAIGSSMSRIEVAIRLGDSQAAEFQRAAGRIADADIAQESAALTRVQILQQASAAVLAQANQQPALALQLLGNQL